MNIALYAQPCDVRSGEWRPRTTDSTTEEPTESTVASSSISLAASVISRPAPAQVTAPSHHQHQHHQHQYQEEQPYPEHYHHHEDPSSDPASFRYGRQHTLLGQLQQQQQQQQQQHDDDDEEEHGQENNSMDMDSDMDSDSDGVQDNDDDDDDDNNENDEAEEDARNGDGSTDDDGGDGSSGIAMQEVLLSEDNDGAIEKEEDDDASRYSSSSSSSSTYYDNSSSMDDDDDDEDEDDNEDVRMRQQQRRRQQRQRVGGVYIRSKKYRYNTNYYQMVPADESKIILPIEAADTTHTTTSSTKTTTTTTTTNEQQRQQQEQPPTEATTGGVLLEGDDDNDGTTKTTHNERPMAHVLCIGTKPTAMAGIGIDETTRTSNTTTNTTTTTNTPTEEEEKKKKKKKQKEKKNYKKVRGYKIGKYKSHLFFGAKPKKRKQQQQQQQQQQQLQQQRQRQQEQRSAGLSLSVKINEIHANDVLCGRGRGEWDHKGNVQFRAIIHSKKRDEGFTTMKMYHKDWKRLLATTIVQEIRAMVPSGRFLKKEQEPTKDGENEEEDGELLWVDIGDERAIMKTMEGLREHRDRSLAADASSSSSVGRNKKYRPTKPINTRYSDQRWNEYYHQFLAYVQSNQGSTYIPADYKKNKNLGWWVQHNRSFWRHGTLSQNRFDILDRINFIWHLDRANNLMQLKIFKKKQQQQQQQQQQIMTQTDHDRQQQQLYQAERQSRRQEIRRNRKQQHAHEEDGVPSSNAMETTTSTRTTVPWNAIHANDVLCGRGNTLNEYPGNVQYRKIVYSKRKKWKECLSVTDKVPKRGAIATSIVNMIRAMSPPGRFLKKITKESYDDDDDDNDVDDTAVSLWFDIGDEKAREKTACCYAKAGQFSFD